MGLPLAALAEPILQSRTILEVEYWGTLGDYYGAQPDARELHNTLRIDLSLAPADNDTRSALGVYDWRNPDAASGLAPRYDVSDFVSNGLQTLKGRSADYVEFGDEHDATHADAFDSFIVHNNELFEHADGSADSVRLNLFITSQADFVRGDALDQAFDVRPDSDHGLGSVSEMLGGVLRSYTFAINRLRVTPRSCTM
jgi:hypothetical protein